MTAISSNEFEALKVLTTCLREAFLKTEIDETTVCLYAGRLAEKISLPLRGRDANPINFDDAMRRATQAQPEALAHLADAYTTALYASPVPFSGAFERAKALHSNATGRLIQDALGLRRERE